MIYRKYKSWIVLLTILVVLIFSAIMLLVNKEPSPIPNNIKKQLSFSLLRPQNSSAWRIDPKSISYSASTNVLTMDAKSQNTVISINEQPQPDTFSDAPQYYPSLLNKLNQYADLQTHIGTVTLTHPKELSGGQTAVLNLKQTLIFAKPSVNLTDSQWKDFFNSCEWEQ